MMDDRRKFMSVPDVAAYWGISTDKVYDDIRKGVLPAYEVGGLKRVRYVDAMNYGQPSRVPNTPSSASTM